MRNAAARIQSPAPDEARHARRVPAPPEAPKVPEMPEALETPEAAGRRRGSTLHWPMSWPAVLYVGDAALECTVQAFSREGAHLTLAEPPPAGAEAVLKFPFTVHLKGEIAWSRERDLGLDFDVATRRSARIVEDLLLSQETPG